jgi:hypothetical protein
MTLSSILFTGFAFAALPAGTSWGAEASTATSGAKSRPLPVVQHDKSKASQLARKVKDSPDYRKAVKRTSKTERAPAEAARVVDEVSRYYAASATQQTKYWNELLDAAVDAKLITAADRRVLKKARENPRVTITGWKPATKLGKELREQFLRPQQGGGEEAEKSTAGDIGTIVGGLIGGVLGGNPMSVGIGAAVGKVAGEAYHTYSNWDSGGDDDTIDGGDGDAAGGGGGGGGGDGE